MATLIAIGLAATAMLAVVYILGSELCVPAARNAVRTGNIRPLKVACFSVSIGECALIVGASSALLFAEYSWQLFTGGLPGRLFGLSAAGILVTALIWEVSGRMRKKQGAAMSYSLDRVLPAHGERREIYQRTRHMLEGGGRTEPERIVGQLVARGEKYGLHECR